MTKIYKKKLLIDLDGVLNEYVGNFDKNLIPKPKQGVENLLENLYKDFDLMLFTTRNKELAQNWLIEHKLNKYFNKITNEKELAWLIIDDRCLKFNGNYNDLINDVKKFKPWYKV